MKPVIRFATENDVPAMLDIYAPFVKDTAITFEIEMPAEQEFTARLQKIQAQYPWVVCELDGEIAGYAYACQYRERIAYQWATEMSVYLHPEFKGKGIGQALYAAVIALLKEQGYFTAYGVITQPNIPSVRLHEKMGFRYFATYEKAGYKLGQWHDVGWWALEIQPHEPKPKTPLRISELANTLKEKILASHSDL